MQTPVALSAFPFIHDSALLAEIDQAGTYHIFQPDDTLIHHEKCVRVIPLITKGTVKVSRVDETGSELFLYYILPGQSCAFSIASHLTRQRSSIKAVAEDETELIAIPIGHVFTWFEQFPSWRTFIAMTLGDRFNDLIRSIDNIAFKRTDERLITFLAARSKAINSNILHITHQEIANELSTSREVVSRLLKRLEQEQELRLSRNRIELNLPIR